MMVLDVSYHQKDMFHIISSNLKDLKNSQKLFKNIKKVKLILHGHAFLMKHLKD